jgi:hypothetical protein
MALEGREAEALVACGRKLEIGNYRRFGHPIRHMRLVDAYPQPMVNKKLQKRKLWG